MNRLCASDLTAVQSVGVRGSKTASGGGVAEKLVVLGARHRNESAARESTLGFRSAPDRPEREGHPSESWFS